MTSFLAVRNIRPLSRRILGQAVRPALRPALPPALLLAAVAPALLAAQLPDTVATRELAPGVAYTRLVRPSGPWVVNVLRVALQRSEFTIRHVRANEQLRSRERPSEMVKRREAAGETVLAAVNADFFDLKSGENENNQVLDGEWWKGVKVTESPFDTFDNVHAQFALDSLDRPSLDRFQFAGEARAQRTVIPLIALNARVQAGPEGAALFTSRFGANTPADTGRAVAEAPLLVAGRRADTVLYVRGGAIASSPASAIPQNGAVLAGYGPRAQAVAALGEGETLRVVFSAKSLAPLTPSSRASTGPQAPLALLVGGWPRIVRDGASIAAGAAAEEGTISRNAEARHPRTAVGFTRDGGALLLVTVDGRSQKSVGMTLDELARLMLELGAYEALNFDGGGSTAMIVQDKIVNTPSDPTGEREVGNALLLVRRARP